MAFVGITANDVAAFPQDGPEETRTLARLLGFPILYDASQAVARAYDAACTPDFYLFDARRRLVYRGQLDESRPGRGTCNGKDLRAAMEALLAGNPIPVDQRPSTGCNIKWKQG